MSSDKSTAGISAMSAYLPRFRVRLADWCDWTGNNWNKIQAVVGHSFRITGGHEDVYTMAANAVLRLIRQNRIDPASIGSLGLGTESSRDNSAGAVIIRGMLDRALQDLGFPRLSRNLEVPEFKHACLGGIYALKNAVRYVCCDGRGRKAIAVASDLAQYQRGSSGEQTQGAGAVAMLVEERARLLEIDLSRAGSVSDYRGSDFRKPLFRCLNGYQAGNGIGNVKGSEDCKGKRVRLTDFPVYSGKYSTFAYIDEVAHAVEEMLRRLDVPAEKYYQSARGLFFHWPYYQMPVKAMSFLYVRGLSRGEHDLGELRDLCREAGVSCEQVVSEAGSAPDLYSGFLSGREQISDPYPATGAVAAALRKRGSFRAFLEEKMSLGSQAMRRMGNLYTAGLPAWLAAGLEEAAQKGLELQGAPMLAVGYGSGDAAEAIPVRAAAGWQEPARLIGIEASLADPIDLTRAQYEALHDGYSAAGLAYSPKQEFVISHVGNRYADGFQDLAVEYYKYVS